VPAAVPATAGRGSGPDLGLGLGLDVGGSQARWALVGGDGPVTAEGRTPPWSGLLLHDDAGRATVRARLAQALREAHAAGAAVPGAVVAGVTGLDPTQHAALAAEFGAAWVAAGLPGTPAPLTACSDIELLCRACFAPGAGMVLYAGTGSVAALVDAQGTLQRAGGRGVLLDDAGGGHWIACRGLRAVWRAEDEAPGSGPASALGRRLFAQLGGSDWAHTRAGVYGADRGAVGRLALAVAQAAHDGDATALDILGRAGDELARLVRALHRRCGPMPVALAGRALDLHPVIGQRLRAALPPGTALQPLGARAEVLAARWAASGRPQAHTADPERPPR
jgi:N-acetylglucosamine kinase-like BadF-type ATPase